MRTLPARDGLVSSGAEAGEQAVAMPLNSYTGSDPSSQPKSCYRSFPSSFPGGILIHSRLYAVREATLCPMLQFFLWI